MKISKRILATLVAVMLVMTTITVPAFAAFTDLTEESVSYDAANVLNMLGVINGYPDGSFKPDNNVTRAEFTAMLLRTRGMGDVGSTSLENPPFPDVTTSDVSWAIGNIRTARELGIINGYDDGTFKPNNNVLYEEAVKMIVCALGYGEMGTEGAFWYSKYLMTASSLGFLNGTGGAIGTPATRATIASMLYNCLEVNLAENNAISDKTILESDLKLTKNEGYICATSKVSLVDAEPNIKDDEIQIKFNSAAAPVTYKVNDAAKYEDMLGAQITFYYTEDRSTKTIVSATVNNTETIEIPASNIKATTTSTIEYLENADDKRNTVADIDEENVVVYNGKLYSGTTFEQLKLNSLIPSVGSIKLLDRNGDNSYDVVFVEDYEIWVVSSFTASTKTIVDDVLRSRVSLTLDDEVSEIKFVNSSGNELGFNSISKDAVLAIKTNSYGEKEVVILQNSSVSGKITAVSSKNGITVNNKTYKFSAQAPWGSDPAESGKLTEPQHGDSGKFYLDIDGNIVAYDKTETVVTQHYGYMIAANNVSIDGFSEELRVAISTKNDTKPDDYNYVISKNSKINGTLVSNIPDPLAALKTNGSFIQGVKFTVASGNTIDEILTSDTKAADGTETDPEELYLYNKAGVADNDYEWTYDSSAKTLSTNAGGGSIAARIRLRDAIILHVPTPGSATKNQIISTDDLINNKSDYKIDAFDVTTADAAKFVIVYGDLENAGVVSSASEVMVVKSIEAVMEGNDSVRVLKGYIDGIAADRNLSVTDTTTVSTVVNAGDVIRISEEDGKYVIKSVIFTKTMTGGGVSAPENDNNGNLAFKTIWGSVDEYDGGTLIMAPSILSPNVGVEIENEISIDSDYFANTKSYKIDVDAIGSEDDPIVEELGTGSGVLDALSYTSNQNVQQSEVFICMNSETSVMLMLVIER